MANLSKTLHINFYQNRSSIVEAMIKKFWCVFSASRCRSQYGFILRRLLIGNTFLLLVLGDVDKTLHGCTTFTQIPQILTAIERHVKSILFFVILVNFLMLACVILKFHAGVYRLEI